MLNRTLAFSLPILALLAAGTARAETVSVFCAPTEYDLCIKAASA